jgi:ribose transport system substrate-binding protein
VTLERAVETPVTLHIGPKNYPIGVKVGEFLKDELGGKGNVVEIKGDPAVAPAVERNKGFRDAIAGGEIKVIAEQHADWDQEKALKFMEDTLQRFGPGQIQAVYAHNDNMAFGALKAIEAAGRADEGILIVGIDGENGAIRAVMDGRLAATFTYSTVAPEGVIAAHALAIAEAKDLLPLGAMTIEIPATLVTKDNAESLLCTGFGDDPKC